MSPCSVLSLVSASQLKEKLSIKSRKVEKLLCLSYGAEKIQRDENVNEVAARREQYKGMKEVNVVGRMLIFYFLFMSKAIN